MKNLVSLHEAIAVALININKETFAATFEEVAAFIEKRGLFTERKDEVDLATQVMLRSTKAKGAYKYLFEQIDENTIQLKNKPVQKAKRKYVQKKGLPDLSSVMDEKEPIAVLQPNERILY